MMENFKPVDDYEGLRKQFSALNNLYQSLSRENTHYRNIDYSLSEARLNHLELVIESERAMNETLTNENESLRQELAKPAPEVQILIDALRKIQGLTGCSSAQQLEAMRDIYSLSRGALAAYDTKATPDNGVEK
jgi:hypothetical protein